ncbi:MAG TPA: virulence protein RhuM/Fic/DOC family protein [Bacilli bacterium]|nr:virulence protein RhuM/Fic/DOC family protein [Bacilli bacterium]
MKEEKNKQIAIYSDKNKSIKVEAVLQKETVWLTQAQIGHILNAERSVITKHLNNIFKSRELDKNSVCAIFAHTAADGKTYKTQYYSLDAIISVGYRVNSQKATQFRIWATKVLREHIINGFTVNRDRLKQLQGDKLDELESAVALIRRTIETRRLSSEQEKGLLRVITDYTNSWVLLTKYDNHQLATPKKLSKVKLVLSYDDAVIAIDGMRQQLAKKLGDSELYGRERQEGLKSLIGNLYQTYGRKPLYPSLEHQAAHLLYFVIKDHPFADGNKRIGAFLFIYFLSRCNHLFKKNGERKINDNALVALTLLVAESDPKEKDVIIKLIMNFLVE